MKKLFCFLPILAFCVAHAPAARAQTVSPDPTPTIITTAPYTITKPGYYQLGADLTIPNVGGQIIVIDSGNVTLDFAGHYISGPNNSGSNRLIGVYAYEKGNINIRNGTVAYCYKGIVFVGNGSTDPTGTLNINQRVDNMLVSYCFAEGIQFNTAYNSDVTNCRVSFIGSNVNNTAGIDFGAAGGGNRAIGNDVTYVSTSSGNAYGIQGGSYASGNTIGNVTGTNIAAGFFFTALAVNNSVSNCATGYAFCPKCKDDLTYNCNTPFGNSGDAGGNN